MAKDLAYEAQVRKFMAGLNPLRAAQLKRFLQHRASLEHGGQPFVPEFVDDAVPVKIHDPSVIDKFELDKFTERDGINDATELLKEYDDGPAYSATPKNKVFSRVNPLYNKQRNILGGTASVIPGGASIPVAWVQSDEEDATVFTVTSFGIIPSSSFADQFRPYVKVTWGTRISPLAVVTADIGLGTQFSLCGAAVFVEVGADLGFAGVTTKTSVTAMLGYNTTQRQSPTTRTTYIDNLATTAKKTIAVPNFATTIQSVQRDDTSAQITLEMLDAQGNTAWKFILATNAFMSNPLQISNDVVSVRVTNGGNGTINGRLIFGLSL